MNLSQILKLGIVAGTVMLLVGTGFHFAIEAFFPRINAIYSEHSDLFRPWSGWTRHYMLIHPVGFGFIFAFVYSCLRSSHLSGTPLRGPTGGALFGVLVFIVGSLPVFFLSFASLRIPVLVIVAWIAQNLTQYVTAGLAIGSIADGRSR
jgi:hypothetical protein